MGHRLPPGGDAARAGKCSPAPELLGGPGLGPVHAPRARAPWEPGPRTRSPPFPPRPPPPPAAPRGRPKLFRGSPALVEKVAGSPVTPRAAVKLLGTPEACRRSLNMAWDPTRGPAWPGQKRQQGTSIFCSNYDLNYELYREDVPYRVYDYHRIPPLINRVPVKLRRTRSGVKSRASRKNRPPPVQIKLRPEELRSIRGELSQIKAQVDSLLEHLECMDRQRDQPAGTKDSEENRCPGSEGSSRSIEPSQEPRGQRANPEADGANESPGAEKAVKIHSLEQEGSQ
ncbi:RNA-binding Raly-like protein [Otolemur garnettii]|uniref:RNA-binding Raly-like protein n=1 Tax=Otolemur garnettii TaxID=30611 RepID=UPI000643FDE8|nr:RNA-binding Raly-like protein [Otolemur garnettii]